MALTAYIFWISLVLETIQNDVALEIAYGDKGWNGVSSVWGVCRTRPNISELHAYNIISNSVRPLFLFIFYLNMKYIEEFDLSMPHELNGNLKKIVRSHRHNIDGVVRHGE